MQFGFGVESSATGKTTGSRPRPSTPNVLLIIADDMRYDQLRFMPNVQRLIADDGRTFTQARCNVPLCQPTRVGLLTGQMSKYNNELGIGFNGSTLNDSRQLLGRVGARRRATAAASSGSTSTSSTESVASTRRPATRRWRELIGETSAYEFTGAPNTGSQTITGHVQHRLPRGAGEPLHRRGRTLLLHRHADPTAHALPPAQGPGPQVARRRLADRRRDRRERQAAVDPGASTAHRGRRRHARRRDAIGSLQELSAVDDMVKQILTHHPDPTCSRNTVVIFTSDNGVHRGEHRRRGAGTKSGPYEVGLHVPLIVRGPGFPPGPTITAPSMVTQDITATILDVARRTAGLPHQAGISLAELSRTSRGHRARVLLHEVGEGFEGQTGDGITTGPRQLPRVSQAVSLPVGSGEPAGSVHVRGLRPRHRSGRALELGERPGRGEPSATRSRRSSSRY